MSSVTAKVDLAPVQTAVDDARADIAAARAALAGDTGTLLSRLTATRAGYLNASISSRASQSSVDTKASQASVNALPTSPVESVQSGTISTNAIKPYDVTIAAVNTSKAFLVFSDSVDTTNGARSYDVEGRILNATTLRFTHAVNNVSPRVIQWQVIEYV